MDDAGVFHKALQFILSEIANGPPSGEAYLLNPGDAGLLKQLAKVDAGTASTRPMEGLTTIASHTAHVLYGFQLSNRLAEGEENPWRDANWETAWRKTEVSSDEWESLKVSLNEELKKWQLTLAQRRNWNDVAARGAVGIAAHLAYHLGAIRQILAAMRKNDAPK